MKRPRIEAEPWDSAFFDVAEAAAIKALAGGTADEEQQRRAWKWIVNRAGRLNRLSFDERADRIMAFSEGRRFVALQLMRIATTPMDELRDEIAGRLKRAGAGAADIARQAGTGAPTEQGN